MEAVSSSEGYSLSMFHHVGVSFGVKLNYILFFVIVSYRWIIVGQRAECFLSVDVPGIGVALGVEV